MLKKTFLLLIIIIGFCSSGIYSIKANTIELLSPQNGEVGLPSNPVLRWSPVPFSGSTIYKVHYDLDTSFNNAVTFSTTSTYLQLGGLSFAATYYWKVTAVTNDTINSSSEVWHFKTGTVWHNVANFAQGQIVWDIVEHNNFIFAGTWGGGIYRSSDFPNYQQWEQKNDSINAAFIWSLASANGYLYSATERGIFRTEDDGNTWHQLPLLVGSVPFPPDVRSIIVEDSLIVAATWGFGVYFSLDSGFTWHKNNAGLGSLAVQALTFGLGSYYIYAGTADAGIFRIENANIATGSWQNSNMPYQYIWSLASASDSTGEYIYSGTYGDGFWRSTNSGIVWTQNNTGLTDDYVYSLYQYDFDLYAGTWPGGVFRSQDYGQTWEDLGLSGFGATGVSSIIKTKDGALMVGTNDGRIFKTQSAGVTTLDENEQSLSAPNNFVLYQNYPNPFNPGTVIRYELNQPQSVNLIIFDTLGREIAELVNEFKPAGVHQAYFDAAELPSGVYFYSLRAGEKIQSRKMIILK